LWGRVARFWVARLLVLLSLLGGAAHAWDAERFAQAAARLGPHAASEAKDLIGAMSDWATQDEDARIRGVNQFYNQRIVFRDDVEVWGQPDYWASPLELLNKGQGDCEDYAIAKYFTLIAVGVPSPKLRLVYVRALVGGSRGAVLAHMVLAYYPSPEAQPQILDNLVADIRPASRRPDLSPVFSFNAEGLWQGVGSATAGDPLARLSRWRDVLNKARQEGLW
jgi:predicted transglutaminase-like cysteine proteinase